MPKTKGHIRTLLIEDSAFMRILLSDYLKSDESINFLGSASNGKDGVDKVKELNPDVVITDMVMPEFDGLYAIENIMKECPTPIIVLSSLDKTDSKIFDALNAGALEFIDKPKSDVKGAFSGGGYKLLDLIKSIAVAKDHISLTQQRFNEVNHSHTFSSHLAYDLVVIGASTGGPGATESVIKRLPGNFAIPVVIAQHMPERFIVSYAERLNKLTPLDVKIPTNGEPLTPGIIYIVPGHSNTRIVKKGGRAVFAYTDERFKEFNFPSVDCLFLSAAEVFEKKVIGVIMSGMGKDGALGMQKIKELGGRTIAQDEESSVVFGMAKYADDEGAVQQIVKLRDIPGYIVSCL